MTVIERHDFGRSPGEIKEFISGEIKFNWLWLRAWFMTGYTGWRIGPFFCVRYSDDMFLRRLYRMYLYGIVVGKEHARVYTIKSLLAPLHWLLIGFLIGASVAYDAFTAMQLAGELAADARPVLLAVCYGLLAVPALYLVWLLWNAVFYFLFGCRVCSEELDYFLERIHGFEEEAAEGAGNRTGVLSDEAERPPEK